MSESFSKMAKAVYGQECYFKCSPNTHVQLQWVLENQSQLKWPTICYLKNYCEDQAYFSPILVQQQKVCPRDFLVLNMNIYIPSNVQLNKIILQLRFMTDKSQPFGDFLIAIIDLNPASNLD
jgi:hypothetical protein